MPVPAFTAEQALVFLGQPTHKDNPAPDFRPERDFAPRKTRKLEKPHRQQLKNTNRIE
jgi:hypothetical protein